LNCLFEFKSQEQIQVNQPGYTEQYDVKCTMYYKDCIAVGLERVNETVLNQATDYFVVNGKKYKVHGVALDGPLQQENVLLVITGELEEHMTS
jgi:hypothetical protein